MYLNGATATKRGGVKLTGHLGGTADSPTVTNHGTINSDLHEVYILAAGTRAFSGDQSMGSNKLTNVANGTNSGDAANYGQMIALFRQMDWKDSVRLATAAALDAYTRTGSVLLADANGALTIDGVAAALNDRVLVKDGAAGADNGIFYVTAAGGAGAAWELTRAVDADADAEVTFGLSVSVEEGTANAGEAFRLTTPDPITVNTTALTFTNFNVALSFGAVSALQPGNESNGVASTAARSDHNHGTNPDTTGDDFGSDSARWDFFGRNLDISGKVVLAPVLIDDTDSPYSVTPTDAQIQASSGAGAITVNLPSAATAAGRRLHFKRVGANDVTLDGNGAETIDGAATLVLDADYASVVLWCDGTGWNIE